MGFVYHHGILPMVPLEVDEGLPYSGKVALAEQSAGELVPLLRYDSLGSTGMAVVALVNKAEHRLDFFGVGVTSTGARQVNGLIPFARPVAEGKRWRFFGRPASGSSSQPALYTD